MNTAEAIKKLWKEAFRDSDEFIEQFMECYHTPDRALLIEKEEKLLSMLHILPFEMNGRSVGYMYGVATAYEERGKGHASKLIEQAIEIARERGFHALVTIPADEKLLLYYERFGFKGSYRTLFEMPDNFDPGTGNSESDLLSILPLREIVLPETGRQVRLKWNG